MPTLSKSQAAKAVARLAAIDAKCKNLYAERDQVESRVIEAVLASKSGSVLLTDGGVVTLRDNFCDRDGNPRNVAFKSAAIKRYEVVTKLGA